MDETTEVDESSTYKHELCITHIPQIYKTQEQLTKILPTSHHGHALTTKDKFLYVISVISNPCRYKRRYQLFNEFCERMKQNKKIKFYTLECQNGTRPFETNAIFKYRTDDTVWLKENLQNIVVSRLPHDWEYVCFCDSDIEFIRPDWAEETVHALQDHMIVQPFSHCSDLGPEYETIMKHTGFAYQYCNGKTVRPKDYLYGSGIEFPHPGYAMAMTKHAYNKIGGLVDFCILGSGDHSMFLALVGMVEYSYPQTMHESYGTKLKRFQDKCEKHIKRNIGYVPGTISHYFHGSKANRRYKERWAILVGETKFNPETDIVKDWQGIYQLDTDNIVLRDDIRKYFKQRNEDCVCNGQNK